VDQQLSEYLNQDVMIPGIPKVGEPYEIQPDKLDAESERLDKIARRKYEVNKLFSKEVSMQW
jgi:hypothetical protein